MLGTVIQIDGFDPATNVGVTLRAASHDDARICHLDDKLWWPMLAKLPELKYDFFDGAFGGQITAPASDLTLQVEAWPAFARYQLADARIQLWTGEIGDPWSGWTQRVDGRLTEQPEAEGGVASIAFAVDDRWLDTPLLATYAGTTGAEGPIALKGQVKPLALGAPRFVSGVLINAVSSIFQISGHGPVEAIDAALERVVRFGAPIADYPSYAALDAATIPRGAWATANAVGMARFGAPPTGTVTFMVRGDRAGPDGWVRLPGRIIRRLAMLAGGAGRISEPSLAALDVARPYNQSIYLDQQTTGRDIIQQLANGVNAVAVMSWLGKLHVLPIGIGAPTLSLAADGSALPPVERVRRLGIAAPFKKLAMGAEKTWTVHPLSDVAFTAELVPMGDYAAGTTYREGNIVQKDGSTWLYIATTPSAGNAPPEPTHWKVLAAAGRDGAGGYNLLADNETHQVPAAVDGTVLSYAGAEIVLKVLSGGVDVTGDFTGDVVSNLQGLTGQNLYPRFTVDGGFDPAEDVATITYRVTGKSGTRHAGLTLDKVFSLTKSKAPREGVSPPLITVSASDLAVHFDTTDQQVTGDITIRTVRSSSTAIPLFELFSYDGTQHGFTGTAQALRDTYGDATFGTTGPDVLIFRAGWLRIIMQSYGGGLRVRTLLPGTAAEDRLAIVKIRDGEKGAKGADGINPPVITVSAAPQTITYNRDNQIASGDVVFTAVPVNAIGPVAWRSEVGHGIYSTPGSAGTVTVDGNRLIISQARMAEVLAYNEAHGFGAKETIIASVSGASHSVTVTKTRDGQNGADGFALSADHTEFNIPAFSNGTIKPSWGGAGGTLSLNRGGYTQTDGVTYALLTNQNVTGVSVNGRSFSFTGVIGEKGSFVIRATYAGQSYDIRIDAKKTLDGAAAFQNTVPISGNGGGSQVTVPAGRQARVTANADYYPGNDYGGRTGQLQIFVRNVTDNGPETLLAQATGSTASRYPNSNPNEPDVETNGTVSVASDKFTTASPDKLYAFRAAFDSSGSGGFTLVMSGSVKLEVTD